MKKRVFTKFIAFLIIITLIIVSFSVPAYAIKFIDETLTPDWANTNAIIIGLSFDNGIAEVSISISCTSGVNKIDATISLERRLAGGKYEAVDSWNKTSTKNYLDFVGTAEVSRTATYRVVVKADVYKNGVGESVEGSYEKSYY